MQKASVIFLLFDICPLKVHNIILMSRYVKLAVLILALVALPAFTATPVPALSNITTYSTTAIKTATNPVETVTNTFAKTYQILKPSNFVDAQVIRVIDGDTIEVILNSQIYKVRYIGIDTPEIVDTGKPVHPYGLEASVKNKELVQDKTVLLEKDVSETDKYGRLLRYVWVGEVFINAELVKLGYAQAISYPPDVKYQELFLGLQREARAVKIGLWGLESSTSTPSITTAIKTYSINPTATLPDSDIVYITRTGEKYHRSGCRYLSQSKILITRENAIAQGYTPCSVCKP
jgi:micrococcal nuclease